ncbi:hypothetical protein HMPREF1210_00535 [Paenisporosarcina sp. HGH0030]|uniref:DUF4362 domain-containing protein n=1 Tax=Paenisporosarcina sp. HGH0030 TaxID=1078085 RepID=UPI00034ECEFA|nr:DUF4362 domain-containing protein [Paenisporosarcina sp. HGH0030]EPD53712.1 hypothetical protein HMPREF1210_00535 [Paenisporosarcina sp. HGH0030]
MKNFTYINILLMLIILLVGCNTVGNDSIKGGTQKADRYKLEVKGVDNVDVLDTHGGVEGWEQMQGFYDNIQNGIASDLRIVHYTIEGAPIVTDLTYNGESLEVKNDYSRDTYGSGEIITNKCGNMVKEANDTNLSYIAIDCNGIPYGMDTILQISYDSSEQDLFEFELMYGEELENEINTLTKQAKKEITVNETEVMADFDLPPHIKQEVFNRLVFANYLAEKDLKAMCDIEDIMNYQLKVHINSGQRVFRWAACDQSVDGVKLTEVAEYIIEQSDKKQSVEPEIKVQGYVLEMTKDTMLIVEEINMLDFEWIKVELPQSDMNSFVFDFTNLEGVNTTEFSIGDKVQATLKGTVRGSKPGSANVKEIKKIEINAND